jgi:hypothetical protein
MIVITSTALLTGAAAAQTASSPPAAAAPIHIPTNSGEVILPNAYDKEAVGTTSLLPDAGVVEIQMIAQSPHKG